MRTGWLKATCGVVVASTLMLTGCSSSSLVNGLSSLSNTADTITNTDTSEATTVASINVKNTTTLLNKLKVTAPTHTTTYQRTKFKHWITQNGCSTRIDVLKAESLVKPKMRGCYIVSGKWVSQYDKKVYTTPSGMDIDHMVPLKEAWISGAWAWSASKRTSYANDLKQANHLKAVSAHSNRQKGDKDPAQWQPTYNKCVYVKDWVAIKYRWKLTIDKAEKTAIKKVLTHCK